MISERAVTIPAGSGPSLEAALSQPAGTSLGVVVCHPHPRYGGDMDSPVVVAAVGACARSGLATLRFNFRGVGASQGTWDEGQGERDDVGAAIACLRAHLDPPARVALAGYSFGAAMALAVATAGESLVGLALIAPPIAAPGWQPPGPLGVDGPVLVVAGSRDTYCPRAALSTLAGAMPAAAITVIDGSDHFFFVGMNGLEAAVSDWASKLTR